MQKTNNSLFPRAKEVDISTEIYRTYNFGGEKGKIKIVAPLTLVVSDNGHRIVDEKGLSHYIPYGWIHLHWKVDEGEAKFYYQRKKDGTTKDN